MKNNRNRKIKIKKQNSVVNKEKKRINKKVKKHTLKKFSSANKIQLN